MTSSKTQFYKANIQTLDKQHLYMSSITIKQAHWIIANTERGTAPLTNLCNYNFIKEDAVDMLEQIQI